MPDNEYNEYRSEDRHESTLIASRVNAMLQSQSLFVTAFVLCNKTECNVRLVIIVLGFVTCLLSLIAISVGLIVLRNLHSQSNDLRKTGPNLTKRNDMPDWKHWLSVDLLSAGLPTCLLFFWIFAFLIR